MSNENIAEVKFFITFNVKDFTEHRSEIFHVHGNPWILRFKKSHFPKNKEAWLSFYLHSAIENESVDWSINASCTVLLTSKSGQKPVRGYIGSAAYYKNNLKWGKSGFILWKDLIDSKQGYVKDNECKLEIIVKSSKRQDLTKYEHFNFEKIQKCCDECSKGVFRLTVKNIYNTIGICTPEFTINNLIWRLSLGEYEKSNHSGSQPNNSLRLKLHNIAPKEEQVWSCQTTIKCTLTSANRNVESVVVKGDGREFNEFTHIQGLTLMKWDDLMNRGNKYLKNGSFSLEVNIKVTDLNGEQSKPTLKRPICNDNLEFACSICWENLTDRSVSSISCGHIFCSACVDVMIEKSKCPLCPTCKQELQAFKSRKMSHKVYLPLQSI